MAAQMAGVHTMIFRLPKDMTPRSATAVRSCPAAIGSASVLRAPCMANRAWWCWMSQARIWMRKGTRRLPTASCS